MTKTIGTDTETKTAKTLFRAWNPVQAGFADSIGRVFDDAGRAVIGARLHPRSGGEPLWFVPSMESNERIR